MQGGVCVLVVGGGGAMASAKHYNTYSSIFACVFIIIIYAYNNIIIKSAINARGVHNNIVYGSSVTLFHLSPKFGGTHRGVRGCQLTPVYKPMGGAYCVVAVVISKGMNNDILFAQRQYACKAIIISRDKIVTLQLQSMEL